MSEYKYDVFFGEEDGYEAHVQITAGTPEDLDTDRKIVLGLLKDIKAKPRFARPTAGPVTGVGAAQSATSTSSDSMVAAARAVFPSGQVEAKCPNDGSVMRKVPAGVSARTNKPYPSFYACTVCQHRQNASA